MLKGEWHELIGDPELIGSWIIWGKSGSGKTRFAFMIAKMFAEHGEKVAYVSLEEGISKSIQQTLMDMSIIDVKNRLSLWVDMSVKDITEALRQQRSPKIVIIDSLQYLGINYAGYKKLKAEFKNKLLIFISHANEQNEPLGSTASSVRYDAFVKILVKSFKAYPVSRFGGNKPMIIWQKEVE
jgi:hypothetical protein